MKNSYKSFYKTFKSLIIILTLLFAVSVHAQPGGDASDDVRDAVPIDGGLSLLVAGAAAYGIKKLRDTKNKEI
tara:strand:- start:711 stop:929 length:219 start_codon:yes stop_codon:yes gene_type:complete